MTADDSLYDSDTDEEFICDNCGNSFLGKLVMKLGGKCLCPYCSDDESEYFEV